MKQLLASFVFFTRLPFWRIGDVPAECYKHVVDYWTLVGWLTGGIMALSYLGASFLLPLPCAAVVALLVRLLVTGALHEDGFADFVDGFGGGTSRQRILGIMKDSHIGTYGVIGLVMYYLLMVTLVNTMPLMLGVAALFAGDVWSKFCASHIVNFLPYARKAEEAKNKTVYVKIPVNRWILSLIIGIIPLFLLPVPYVFAAIAPIVTTFCVIAVMKRKIQGYTGDCCGATFIIGELAFILALSVINHLVLWM